MVARHTGTDRLSVIITVADRMWRGFFINWLASSPWDTDNNEWYPSRMLFCRS